jgi:uncharacterized membrane protein YccC
LAIWVGLCAYVAGMLDGNRAYAAALASITVALIAVEQIDSPLQVFPTGVARGAAIGIGVLAVALVNEVLAAPSYHPVLASRLEALQFRVSDFAQNAIRGEASSAMVAAEMLRDVASLHPEIASLTTESSSGTARTAAARTAMVDLVTGLSLARALAVLPRPVAAARDDRNDRESSLTTICRDVLLREIAGSSADVRSSLEALRTGMHPRRPWRAPLYRSRRIAAEGGVRAAIHFMLIAMIFVMAGWPSTELCLAVVAVIIGLSSTAPDPRGFTTLAIFAMPIACVLAGILKYLVFDGVSEFQLLAIGLAPVVIGPALLITLPNRILSPIGRLVLVFLLIVLAPSNPQSYDPQVFVVTCLFLLLSAVLVFAAQLLLPSLSSDKRIRLLVGEARRDLHRLDSERARKLAPGEAAFRDAARIEQIMTANGEPATKHQAVAETMRWFDQAAPLRRSAAELDRLAASPLKEAASAARAALALRDDNAIMAAAEALRLTAAEHNISADQALAALVTAGIAFQPSQRPTDSSQGTQP